MPGSASTRRRNWPLAPAVFGARTAELRSRLDRLQPRHVVFCSFENRFAKSGGLAAVAVNTLPFLKETNRLDSVSLMTPFYPLLMDAARLDRTGLRFQVGFGGRNVETELLRYECAYSAPRPGALWEYYLKADGFFGAGSRLRDPYLYAEEDASLNERRMLDSALFFCAAVPAALAALGVVDEVVLHLQEWQTALLALTAKDAMLRGTLKACATVQTMHNPYDCFVPKPALQQVVADPSTRDRIQALPGQGLTAFQIGLSLVDAPVATVSSHFARELTSDILQTRHFAPHLQKLLRGRVVGINNGPFAAFSGKFPKRERHTPQEIGEIKRDVRKSLLEVLHEYAPPERFGELTFQGGPIVTLPDDVPIVVMSGRLDPMQKGYDILLQALERFAADEIKAVMTPMAVRDADLNYFREAAAGPCRGNLVVFPFRMARGFVELQTGSTFGLMPSIYEPFGAAIEYMTSGTVNVARSTGGLVDQVTDGDTGFLFREPDPTYTLSNIERFASDSGRVQARKNNPWATGMADALESTLRRAIAVYRDRRDDYHTMILRGFERAAQFSWEQNASRYWDVYRMASGKTARG